MHHSGFVERAGEQNVGDIKADLVRPARWLALLDLPARRHGYRICLPLHIRGLKHSVHPRYKHYDAYSVIFTTVRSVKLPNVVKIKNSAVLEFGTKRLFFSKKRTFDKIPLFFNMNHKL